MSIFPKYLDSVIESKILSYVKENKKNMSSEELYSPCVYSHNMFYEDRENLLKQDNMYMVVAGVLGKLYWLDSYSQKHFVLDCKEPEIKNPPYSFNQKFTFLTKKSIKTFDTRGESPFEETLKSCSFDLFTEPEKYEIPSIANILSSISDTSGKDQWLFLIKIPRIGSKTG